MKYEFTVTVDTAKEFLIGDKERIAQALERVPGVRRVSFPNIEYTYMNKLNKWKLEIMK